MKKITFFLIVLMSFSVQAQTTVWSSDSEDYLTDWGVLDNDGDTYVWGVYTGGAESFGFNSGALFYSESYNPSAIPTGLSPDNLLFTPTFFIPGTAVTISFKMKVAALDSGFPAENFSVYVYDDAIGGSFDDLIYTETLAVGGTGTAKDITAPIPASFANKTVGIIIRHHDCTDQNQLLVDDFEVSYSTALSVNDISINQIIAYPNPVNDILNIDTALELDLIEIFNLIGQKIIVFNKKNIINNSINLSELKKGLYMVIVTSGNKTQTLKITKQ
jgi:hypothetical protein